MIANNFTYRDKEIETSWLHSVRLSSHQFVHCSSSGLGRLE